MRIFITAAVITAALAVTALAACSAPAIDPGPRFDDENQTEIACMKHQPHPPGARYTDPALKRTEESLPLLRYYTANGTKPYCDGSAPSDVDRAWARLYVDLGADRAKVDPLLT